jgi:hypothetical protein
MMTRRTIAVLTPFALSFFVAPLAADARQAENVFRVGFLGIVPPLILDAFQ